MAGSGRRPLGLSSPGRERTGEPRMSHCHRLSLLLGVLFVPSATATAQLAGSRGGVTGHAPGHAVPGMQGISPEVVQGYIAIDGQAELRVKPTQIRVVMAVTAEGTTPADCKRQVADRITTLATAWRKMGISQENIVEDFIAVLPRYAFEIDRIHDREVAVEKKVGYLMQSNLHLAVKDDARAMAAIHIAFENDVADIIAFDYWSKELDPMKVRARAEALKAARDKGSGPAGRPVSTSSHRLSTCRSQHESITPSRCTNRLPTAATRVIKRPIHAATSPRFARFAQRTPTIVDSISTPTANRRSCRCGQRFLSSPRCGCISNRPWP